MKAAVGMLLLTALAAAPAAADIRVWTEKDRQGDGREIRSAVRDLRNFNFDDRISSLQADEPWEVCSEPLYRGDCRIVNGTVLNLRPLGLNNRITSMRRASEEMIADIVMPPARETTPDVRKPERRTTERAIAEPPATESRPPETATVEPPKVTPPETKPERPRAQSTERKSETQPAAPLTATVLEPKPEPQHAAPPTEAPAKEPAKRERKAERTAPPSEPAPVAREWWEGGDDGTGGPPTLEVFEKPNFEGRKLRLEQAVTDLTDLDQPVGSLLVRAGSWKICSKPKFRGRCRTMDATGMGVPDAPLIGSLRPETE